MKKIKLTEQDLTNIVKKVIQEADEPKKKKLFVPLDLDKRTEELKKYLDDNDFTLDESDPDLPILIWSEHFKKTKDTDGEMCWGFKKTATENLMELFYSGVIDEGGLTYFKVIGDDSKLPDNHGWITAEMIDEMNDKIFFSVQQWG